MSGLVIAALACSAPPASSRALPSSRHAVDGGSLRPARLVYAGRHEGDHPTWSYRDTVTIERAERGGRPVWRRTSRHAEGSIGSVIDLDRQSLAPVHAELSWSGLAQRVEFGAGELTGAVVEGGAELAVRTPYRPGAHVDALDMYVAALPLAPGFRAEVDLLDVGLLNEGTQPQTRRFVIRVERQESVTVPAGTRSALVVAIEPTDGNQRLAARYHVATAPPHHALRMQYVVNPATAGQIKRSTGTDELVSIEVAP